jgi:uncharacterized SAM-binding protein YcdF (DUF218 family)
MKRFDLSHGLAIWLRLLVGLLLLFGLAGLVFLCAGALLASPASQPHRADAVVVLGGGDGARYARGRELVLAGFAQQLVLFEPNADERQDALVRFKSLEIWDDVLPRNSWGEAQAVRAWMLAKGLKSVLVVSDPPHLLRVQYAWASNFWRTELDFSLLASIPPWWSSWCWWQNPRSKRFVEDEVLKLGYYVLHYRFGLW